MRALFVIAGFIGFRLSTLVVFAQGQGTRREEHCHKNGTLACQILLSHLCP
jgi:hypothetical protein